MNEDHAWNSVAFQVTARFVLKIKNLAIGGRT